MVKNLNNLAYFDNYTAAGLQIIPLRSKSKIPINKKWNRGWDRNMSRAAFEANPNLNMGILLGNVIDVEGDSKEANQWLEEVTLNVPHPVWSSDKSRHHLFMAPEPFNIRKTTIKFRDDLEFRGRMHHSALPPSIHPHGAVYEWVEYWPTIPEMPPSLMEAFIRAGVKNKKRRKKKKGRPQKGYIRPWCFACERKCKMHTKRHELECKAFQTLDLKWQCYNCREVDIRDICRQIRKQEYCKSRRSLQMF